MPKFYPKNRNIHRPPHIYLSESTYFVTTKTFDWIRFFNTDKKKNLFLNVFKSSIKRFQIKMYAWVVLDNHYHILFWIRSKFNISKFFQNLHANSSRLLNEFDKKQSRKIWHQYQDHIIRDERDFWRHFNYIHHNSIKRRYTEKMEDYKFSSYKEYLKKYGIEWLDDCFEQYPIIDFTIDEEA